jgi:TPR repeat protein
VKGTEVDSQSAVMWWQRCVDLHRHIKATFELAVAFYTGEGVPENPELAVNLFRRAAHSGHAGAAYMLGECLLDGVGSARDRASALEWLVTAAELGHHLARHRVVIVLQQDHEKMNAGQAPAESDEQDDEDAEALKWVDHNVRVGDLYIISGTTGAAEILQRRKTKVMESRDNLSK